jgi:hypothetical protein
MGPVPGRVYTLQWLELHGNVPRKLLLDFSTLQGPELYVDVCTLKRPVLNLEVSLVKKEPELHINLSALRGC